MKASRYLFKRTREIVLAGVYTVLMVGCTGNKALIRQDMKDDLTEAWEATQTAKEKKQVVIESGEQFYSDYRETKVRELVNRSQEIDDRIWDLKKIAKHSLNQQAVVDVNSAIQALQEEKSGLNKKIDEVKAVEAKNWSASYEEVNQALSQIEGELNRLFGSPQ